ncbi:ABC transporter ATP-binding protein [Desulfovibrio sp. OttesenSCG-928-C14]|nr:ABC transporter ATP-binding protein [Desulfovibrio sp. OttesenSCG-928-C14]
MNLFFSSFKDGEAMLLEIRDLQVGFATPRGLARAVDGVDLFLDQGGVFALVGESGCGKSVSALAVLGLLPRPAARVLGGSIRFAGQELLNQPESDLAALRGSSIGMVFQEPMTSLNPVFNIGEQVAEPLRLHLGLGKSEARQRAVRMLEKVGLPDPQRSARAYPHQLSGGMRQRVMIAMAMACKPRLLIADEPTTALDVSMQGQILALMRELREESGSALLLITHDLDVVAQSGGGMAVMYAGRIVESGPAAQLLARPLHPYTQGLLASRPSLAAPGSLKTGGTPAAPGIPRADEPGTPTAQEISKADAPARSDMTRPEAAPAFSRPRLHTIPGTVPAPLERPAGCAFSTRCPKAFERCRREMPPLFAPSEAGEEQLVRCWLRAN